MGTFALNTYSLIWKLRKLLIKVVRLIQNYNRKSTGKYIRLRYGPKNCLWKYTILTVTLKVSSIKILEKSCEVIHMDAKVNWISPASPLNSTTVTTLTWSVVRTYAVVDIHTNTNLHCVILSWANNFPNQRCTTAY